MILACVFLIVSKWKHCQIWRNKVYLRQCNQCFLTTFDSWFNSRGEETKRLDLKTPPSALEICFFILTSHCRPGKTYQSIKMCPFSVTHTQRKEKKKNKVKRTVFTLSMNLSSVSHNIINHMSNYWTRFHPAGWEEKKKTRKQKDWCLERWCVW